MITPLNRLLRYRLVIPILRGTGLPDYTARGVGIGVAVSLTPLVGVQMPIVVGIWSLIRLMRPSWTFNLGLPLFVGCVPWMIVGGWIGYRWSHIYIERFKVARRERQDRKAARKQAAALKAGQPATDNHH